MKNRGEAQEIELARLRDDYPLYARLCLKIRPKRGGDALPLVLNGPQLRVQAAIDSALADKRPARIIELKARQTGMSTDAEGRLFHRCHLRENRGSIVVAHRVESAQAIFAMSRYYYEHLPAPLRPSKKRYFSKGQIEFAHNGSRLQVQVAGPGTGRGFTAQYVHLSELAFYQKPDEVLDAVLQTVPETDDSIVIVESTAKGLNYFYEMWIDAKSGRSDFTPIFVPWFEDISYALPTQLEWDDATAEELDLKEKFNLTLSQIAWRRWAIRNKCKGVLDTFRQEYPCTDEEAFIYSGKPVFSRDAMRHYNTFVPPNVPRETLPPRCDVEWDPDKSVAVFVPHEYGPARKYSDAVSRHRYLICVDPSEGYGPLHVTSYNEGSHPSPIVVLDQMNFEVPFVWHGRRRPDRLAHTAAAVAHFYNEGMVVWDASPHGLAFQVELEKIYWHFYMREAPPDSKRNSNPNKAGYSTNTRTRSFLVDGLVRFIDDKLPLIRSPELVAEMTTFYYNDRTGRPEALSGAFDDLLFCLAMGVEVHRGSPDNELEPLPLQELEDARAYLFERRVAASMGLRPKHEPDRLRMTAAELERLDELDSQIARKRRADHRQV